MDTFNKIQEKYHDIDMSKLKPDFDEVDGVIGKTVGSQSSSSTEVKIQAGGADAEKIQTKEGLIEGALVEEVPSKEASDKVASDKEVPAKGAISEDIVAWSP